MRAKWLWFAIGATICVAWPFAVALLAQGWK